MSSKVLKLSFAALVAILAVWAVSSAYATRANIDGGALGTAQKAAACPCDCGCAGSGVCECGKKGIDCPCDCGCATTGKCDCGKKSAVACNPAEPNGGCGACCCK